jgi:hypothetical protein
VCERSELLCSMLKAGEFLRADQQSLCLTLSCYFLRNPKNIPTAPAPVDGRYPERMCLSP